MSNPINEAIIQTTLVADTKPAVTAAKKAKNTIEKDDATIHIKGETSSLDASIKQIKGYLQEISKSFAKNLNDINTKSRNIKFKNLETSISNLENLFAELKDTMTIVDSEGKRLLRVNGMTGVYKQINKVGESLTNIKDILDSIAQKQGVLSARSVTTIQKDIEETTKKAKALQDTLANISSSKKFSQSKQDLSDYFDSKSAKTIAQKIISNDDNVGSISGIDKFVKNVIRVYAQGEEEISKYSFEFQEKAYSLTQIVNEIFATGKAYDNTSIPGLDALKLMNSAISDQTTGLQALNKELEIAKGKESSAFKVSIDTDSLNNLSEALKNLNVKIGEGTSLGFKTEDIDRITNAFNEVKNVLTETLKPLSEIDLKNLGSIFSSDEIKPFLDTITNIETQLTNISKTLGVIDDSNSFNNILTSVDKLFAKLSRMQQKIGTGIYNVEIKQGENFGSSQDLLISNERDRLLKSYDKIVKSFGDEEKLFSSMGNVLSKTSGFGANANELFQLFSKSSVAAIENPMEQINRIREFLTRFKEVRSELRQEVETLNKDLEYANQQLKETSNKDEKQNIRDRITSIKQELKYTSELSTRIDKLSTPSSTNAFLNKKIESATESEKEFIKQMNELKSVDLSGVIEQLTNIHNEIKAIAQDKLLTELIQTLTEQLNSISAQFGNFLTQFKSTATDTSSITAEQQGLEKLRDLLLEIANAVDAKTSAFQIEESTVTGVLQNEINKVDELGRKVSDVTKNLNELNSIKIGQNNVENLVLYGQEGEQLSFIKQEAEAKRDSAKASDELTAAENKRQTSNTNPNQITIDQYLDSLKQETNIEQELSDTAKKTTSNISSETDAIEKLAIIAERAAKAKQDVTNANKDLSNSAKETTSNVNAETNAIENKAKAAEESVTNNSNGQANGSNRIKLLQDEIKLTNTLNKLRAEIVAYTNQTNPSINSNDLYVTSRQEQIASIQEQINALGDLQKTEKEQTAFEEATYKRKQAYTDAVAKAQKSAAEAAKQKADADRKAAENEQKISAEIDKTINSLIRQASTLKNNGKLMKAYGNQIDLLIEELKGMDRSVDPNDIKSRLSEIRNELSKIQAEANLSGNTGKTIKQMLTGRFKSLIAYLGSFASFYRVVGYIRSAITTIQDLDTQLIDLRKTTKMSARELDEFYKSSSDIAKQMGVTTSEIIQQAAAWSRLGYNTKEASTQMAELSSQFASISPGVTVDQGTDYLVSTMQAFGVQTDEVKRKIMDNVNAVGNAFATTNGEIGEMLTRSSAAMKAANNTLEETIALESAAVEITRNAETTGTAFRTVSMRVRGLDEETEEELENYEELKGKIADLTKTTKTPGGISLFTDETKTEFKSTYQLLKEISEIYHDLTDKQQAELLETLAGDRFARGYRNIVYRTHLIARTA